MPDKPALELADSEKASLKTAEPVASEPETLVSDPSLPAASPTPIHRWIFAAPDPSLVKSLAANLAISTCIAEIIVGRGLTDSPTARMFMDAPMSGVHDPLLLRDMDRAIERILRAIREHENVRIFGDYDVDGTTSTVLLKTVLAMAGLPASHHIPHRLKEGYGIHPAAVDQAAADGVTLIISVDTGIRAGEVIDRARELGLDVIVTDHHLPEAELPPAFAVLNPNRPDCTYPNKHLCGAGVVFKLVHGLLLALGWSGARLEKHLASFLKLVAIATVSDVVPLLGENRIFVRHGLAGLRDVRNPGLRALMEIAGLKPGQSLSAAQVAFRIAPRINAAGRMDDAGTVIELFETRDSNRAQAIAQQLHDLNSDRQAEEKAVLDEILDACEKTPVNGSDFALIFSSADWHRGVLGIAASRIVERFHRPVFVLSEEDGLARGSGRSIHAFHLLEALESMPEMFRQFGGHSHAAGVTLNARDVEQFRTRLNSFAASRLTPDDLLPAIVIDSVVKLNNVHDRLFHEINALAPFGASNREPLLAALDLEVAAFPTIKEKVARIPLRQNGRTLFFTTFRPDEQIAALQPGDRLDAAFRIGEDSYRGGWSLYLQHFRRAACSAGIE